MTFGREKRLWLAALALLAPTPLPFNQVLEWPYLFVYALFVIHFFQRAERGSWITLSNWQLNLLGLISIPIVIFDLRAAFFRNSVVTALAHLLMFLLVVKLYSIRREKDKWHIMVAIFFLFVGAMATSSHVTIAPYLLAMLVLSLLVLGRFAHLHVMAPFSQRSTPATSGPSSRGPRAAPLPFRSLLIAGTLIVVMLAVPLFATMPRIREPYILGRGTGSAGMARTTGFSDSVDLNLTTSIRGNRNIAMRVQFGEPAKLGEASDLRFKGAAYDRYEDRNWSRVLRRSEVLVPKTTQSSSRVFELAAESTPANTAEIYRQPGSTASLLLPMEALSVELDIETALGRDTGGAVLLPFRPREPIRYRVTLAEEPVIVARLADDPESSLSALDQNGLTPRMIELARKVMRPGGEASIQEAPGGDLADSGLTREDSADRDSAGDGLAEDGLADDSLADDSPAGEDSTTTVLRADGLTGDGLPDDGLTDDDRIDLLEQHLLTQYSYTLDFLGRDGESPLEDFLFVYKSGHCELFASAMVLMLRSQGIPARLVTGFLGAELNPLEGYYVVRQQNAHAWVEAYTPTRGWQVYDPTPPDGRPAIADQSLALLLSQIYDYVTFRWDRYVLTYGADDQDSFFRNMRERVQGFWARIRNLAAKEPGKPPVTFADEIMPEEEPRSPWIWQPRTSLGVLVAMFALAAAVLVIWNRRRPLSGQAAYVRLRRRLERSGLEVTEFDAPLDLLDRAIERLPDAAEPLRYLVDYYVRESFAERELDESERRGLRDALRSIDQELAEDRRRQRRERRKPSAAALPASAG